MAKKTFVCQQCGLESPKWFGRCPECGEWNSFKEISLPEAIKDSSGKIKKVTPQTLSSISLEKKPRLNTGNQELDRVLGGGLVPGSLVLVAGEPGIGKSTLLLQLASFLGGLYVSGEESLTQIKLRAERLKLNSQDLLLLAETDLNSILGAIKNLKGGVVIIDSIQTLTNKDFPGYPGSVSQVRNCTNFLLKIAKSKNIPIFLVGHITKEGVIAGPKILEHLVDTVLYLEGERFGSFRIIKAVKNRFGPTDEVGVLEMTDEGMKEVANPSLFFLNQKKEKMPGSVVLATMEGTRCLLVEIQGLAVPTNLAVPRRVAQGVNYNRLQMIVAVLTKILNLPLGGFDIYLNVTGGLKIEEPASDLAVALAIYSSFKNIAFSPAMVCWGELGLLGEIRGVGFEEKRRKESERLGFKEIVSPKNFSSLKEVVKTVASKVIHK